MTRQAPSSKSVSKSELARRRFELMAAEYLQRMGQRIAQRREELGLKQEDVARALPGRTSGSHVSRWERGLHRPSDDTLDALATVLKVDVSYFLAAQPDKSDGTPDLFPAGVDTQLDRIEQALAEIVRREEQAQRERDEILKLLARQESILADMQRVAAGLPADETLDAFRRELEAAEARARAAEAQRLESEAAADKARRRRASGQ